MATKDLDIELNKSVKSGLEDTAVQAYLKLISTNFSEKSKQISQDTAIKELLKANFAISDPQGTQKLNSQRLYQALWRTANRMKPLDFMIHGTGRKAYHEKIVTDGVSTVMDRGGYDSALRDKNGVFYGMLTVGDKFLQVGMNTNKKSMSPVLFTPIDRSRVYMDNFCTGIRNRGKAGSAFRALAVSSYSYQQVCDMYPEYAKIGGSGKIPTKVEDWETDSRSWEQRTSLEDETEIAYGYNIINGRENFTVFAGSACTVLEQYEGEEYPYVKNGDSYIPLLQFICIPSEDGPYNYGIGHLLYKLAIVTSRLLNMELGHAEDNTYPITLINTPQSEAATFFQKLAMAEKMRAAGKKPFVSMEYDPNAPGSGAINAQSLLTQNLSNEWQLIYNTLVDEIQMLGINLKELTMEGNPTATEILSDEENSNSWVKQTMEYNASESQEAVEITMSAIKEFVPVKSKIPLNLTTAIQYEGKEVRPDNVTLGQVSKELKDYNYFVKVNSRTGAIPSNTMLRAKIMQSLPFLPEGSPALMKASRQLASLNDLDFTEEDFGMQAPQAQQAPAEAGVIAPSGTETDRMSFLPRLSQQQPVI
jgi:hypothetical protein